MLGWGRDHGCLVAVAILLVLWSTHDSAAAVAAKEKPELLRATQRLAAASRRQCERLHKAPGKRREVPRTVSRAPSSMAVVWQPGQPCSEAMWEAVEWLTCCVAHPVSASDTFTVLGSKRDRVSVKLVTFNTSSPLVTHSLFQCVLFKGHCSARVCPYGQQCLQWRTHMCHCLG